MAGRVGLNSTLGRGLTHNISSTGTYSVGFLLTVGELWFSKIDLSISLAGAGL